MRRIERVRWSRRRQIEPARRFHTNNDSLAELSSKYGADWSQVDSRAFDDLDRDRFVYFLQSGRTGDVKIGQTKNIEQRLRQLRTAASDQLKLVGLEWTYPFTERDLHQMFTPYRLQGEWFTFSPELGIYINTYARPLGGYPCWDRVPCASEEEWRHWQHVPFDPIDDTGASVRDWYAEREAA